MQASFDTYTYEYLDSETLDGIFELMDGDSELLVDLVDTLAESTPELMSDLQAGVAENNPDQIRNSAHALKSSNAQLGALNFAKLCQEMESIGKEGQLDDAEKILELIKDEYKRVEAALNSWKGKILS